LPKNRARTEESKRPVPVAKPLSSGFDGVVETTIEPERKTIMTSKDKMARRKLSLLELASELSNVSRACELMGYSRQQFYEIRRNFQTYGAEGLIDRLPGARGPHPNRVPAEIEQAVLEHALTPPLPWRNAGRAGTAAQGHPGLVGRGTRGLAAKRPPHQA
jgi:Winged helix-turn helix